MHWFIDPIQNHYADFNGRVSVKEYWMFVLGYIIVSIVVSIVEEIISIGDALSILLTLVLIIPSIALAARRLHDINKSGWWQLIALIPIVGWIILIVWLATKSDAGPNPYGPAPVVAAEESIKSDTSVVPTPETSAPVGESEPTVDTSPKEETEEKTDEGKQA